MTMTTVAISIMVSYPHLK